MPGSTNCSTGHRRAGRRILHPGALPYVNLALCWPWPAWIIPTSVNRFRPGILKQPDKLTDYIRRWAIRSYMPTSTALGFPGRRGTGGYWVRNRAFLRHQRHFRKPGRIGPHVRLVRRHAEDRTRSTVNRSAFASKSPSGPAPLRGGRPQAVRAGPSRPGLPLRAIHRPGQPAVPAGGVLSHPENGS